MTSPGESVAATAATGSPCRSSKLWTPGRLGGIEVADRLAMSLTTRRRADADGRPNARMAMCYIQRASFGMIMTEGTYPSAEGRAHANQPGILAAHASGWSRVTDGVQKNNCSNSATRRYSSEMKAQAVRVRRRIGSGDDAVADGDVGR